MDNLKGVFENFSPEQLQVPPGHEERFKTKLDRNFNVTRSKGVVLLIIGYTVAASIGLILFLSILTTNKRIEERVILASETPETIEAEMYLKSLVAKRMEQIHSLDTNQTHSTELLTDIEDFNVTLTNLRTDLQEVPGDQRIVDAVINTYLMKIEALDNIVYILQKFS